MKKVLILIMTIFSLFIFVSCSEGGLNNENKPDDENNEPDLELPVEKEKYKVYMLNGKLDSGDDDMYDFYILTKAGKKLTITVIKTYEKEYLNSVKAQSEPEVEEGFTDIYTLSFDGNNYTYNKLGSNNKYIRKYLNYSEDGVYGGSQEYSKIVSYILSDDPNMTYELYMNSLFRSDKVDDSIFQSMPVVSFIYYGDLVFNKNKIYSIAYSNNGESSDYYSNAFVLKEAVNVLNELEWTKDKSSLGITPNNNEEKIIVSINRHLVSDKNNLMLHSQEHIESGTDYLLYYDFYLDSGFVTMGYMNLSSTINNIYAKLTTEQINKIRGIIKEELIRDYSLGDYIFTSHPVNADALYMMVRLKENNIANIYTFPANYFSIPNPTFSSTVATGTYYVYNANNTDFLVITDGSYNYKFKLTSNGNKGIVFVEEGSNVSSIFSARVSDGDIFYYGKLLNVSSYAYLNKMSVHDLGERRIDISDLMTEYAKNVKTGTLDDVLYNVTPSELSNICTIYKFDKSCTSFLEYNGKIYVMGRSFGGYGVTQLAYRDTYDKKLLYYISSWGSGLHRSEVFAFDFNEEKIKRVVFDENDGKSMPYDVTFSLTTTTNVIKLGIFKSTFGIVDRPFKFDMTKEEVIIDNILDCDLIDAE